MLANIDVRQMFISMLVSIYIVINPRVKKMIQISTRREKTTKGLITRTLYIVTVICLIRTAQA